MSSVEKEAIRAEFLNSPLESGSHVQTVWKKKTMVIHCWGLPYLLHGSDKCSVNMLSVTFGVWDWQWARKPGRAAERTQCENRFIFRKLILAERGSDISTVSNEANISFHHLFQVLAQIPVKFFLYISFRHMYLISAALVLPFQCVMTCYSVTSMGINVIVID